MIINPYIYGGGSASYLLYEDWSGTTIPSDWTSSAGSPDYSTDGKVSLDFGDKVICDVFTSQSTAYFAFTVEFDAIGNSSATQFLRLYDSSSTLIGYVQLMSADTIQLRHGTNFGTSTTLASASTKYYMWGSYTSSGGYSLRIGTTGTYASATLEINGTNGTSTAGLAQMELGQLFNDTGGDLHCELVAVDDVPIGDMP